MNGTALITGASSGIGTCMARILAEDGWDLVISGRNIASLESIRDELTSKNDVNITVIGADLSKDGAAEKLFSDVQEKSIDIDFLINCAGFGDLKLFKDCDPQWQSDMIHVNDVSLVILTRLFLTGMIERHSGRILNVSSIAAFQPGPLMSVYYASKAFVQSFTEALAVELKGTGVTASALCPGPTDTGFMATAGATGKNLFKKSACASAEKVAAYGLKKAMKGKVIILPGSLKLLPFSERFFPRSFVRKAVYFIQSRPDPDAKK